MTAAPAPAPVYAPPAAPAPVPAYAPPQMPAVQVQQQPDFRLESLNADQVNQWWGQTQATRLIGDEF